MDYEAMAGKVVESVRGFINRSLVPISKRVDNLDHRATRHGEHLARLETRLAALERRAEK